jgi:hypothetical protein
VQESIHRACSGMSDFGSEMGAANLAQVRSSEVTMPPSRWLTCLDVGQQALCPPVCSVRIEGVRGSNPLSSTEKLQVRGSPTALILPAGWELSPYWEESGRSCPTGSGRDSHAGLAWLALSAVSDVLVW